MKKIGYLLILLISAVSCTKTDYQPRIVFKASFSDDYTKVDFADDNRLCWRSDDRISVFGSRVREQYRFVGEDWNYHGEFEKVEDGTEPEPLAFDRYYAFSPYSAQIECEADGSFRLAIPSTQTYAEGKSYINPDELIMTAVTASKDDRNLKFKQIFGVLELSIVNLDPEKQISRITVSGNNDELLCGIAQVTFDGSGCPVCTLVPESSGQYVTLDCSSLPQGSVYGTYYIPLLPTTFTKGFTITTVDADGDEYVMTTSRSLSIVRGNILPMKQFCLQGGGKPIIGITHYNNGETSTNYHKAILNAGGYPLNLKPVSTKKEAQAQVDMCDGIFIPGSTVDAYNYADEILPRLAVQSHKWVMGICHGCQFINLSLGGTREATSTFKGAINHKVMIDGTEVIHYVDIDKNSRMYSVLGGIEKLGVNSRHTLCVSKIAPGLSVVAWCSEDGVIPEAIEGEYCIGYQFHPEYWARDGIRPYLNLFEDYIQKVKSTMK